MPGGCPGPQTGERGHRADGRHLTVNGGRVGAETESIMRAEIVKLDPDDPERAFSQCRDVIERGGVIAYPTETFYGLGVDPKNASALRRLFEIKGRRPDQPILLLLPSQENVKDWASRSEEHTSELQSPTNLVCRLL